VVTHKHIHNDKEIQLDLKYGDFSKELANATAALRQAKEYVANDHQAKMLAGYIKRHTHLHVTLITILIYRDFTVSRRVTWSTTKKAPVGGLGMWVPWWSRTLVS